MKSKLISIQVATCVFLLVVTLAKPAFAVSGDQVKSVNSEPVGSGVTQTTKFMHFMTVIQKFNDRNQAIPKGLLKKIGQLDLTTFSQQTSVNLGVSNQLPHKGKGNVLPPGQSNKKTHQVGKGNKQKTKGSDSASKWSGEWLEPVEPLLATDYLLGQFNLNPEDKAHFELAYPSVLPLENTYITSDFGKRKNPGGKGQDDHRGLDLHANYQNVWATGAGLVTYAGYDKSYGYLVIIDHGYGMFTKYAHNSTLLVTQGQRVSRYDVIAISGNTGNSTGPHMHYEIIFNGVHQDPMKVIYQR